MNKLLRTTAIALLLCPPIAARAQNTTCATRPPGDSSNACASTAFVQGAASNIVQTQIPCTQLNAFGADPTGAAFSDSAWTTARASTGAANACYQFGAGNYKFSAAMVANLAAQQGITIQGSGKDVTKLTWPNGGGITLNRQTESVYTIQGMSLLAGKPASGDAILVNDATGTCATSQATSSITNVVARGSDGIGHTNYWGTGILAQDSSLLNITNTDVFGEGTATLGNGILYEGNRATSCLAVALNIQGGYLQSVVNGLIYGDWAQGVTVNQTNFNASSVGIATAAGAQNLDQLSVSHSQFNTSSEQISLGVAMPDVSIHDNLFFVPAGHAGIAMAFGSWGVSITGNNFKVAPPSTAGGWGILVAGSNSATFNGGVITGNTYDRLVFGNQFTAATNWNVQSNDYNMVTTPNDTTGGCTGCTIGGGSP